MISGAHLVLALSLLFQEPPGDPIPISAGAVPGKPFDYASMAFYPERWEEGGHTAPMVPWAGDHVALVTTGAELDPDWMAGFVRRLDGGWALYDDLIGPEPRTFKTVGGLPTICALPASNLSCGYGCGFVGSTGIEMTEFYDAHLPLYGAKGGAVPHAYFYEMGRNYFVFGDRHSCFTTGFAVFMRYVCMDTLGIPDVDGSTRKGIDDALRLWEASGQPFVWGFTDLGGASEKEPRLKDGKGRSIALSDQNVLYASLLLHLRKEHGGDRFVRDFYRAVESLPEVRPRSAAQARKQCLGLVICASIAARRDLAPDFCDRWGLDLRASTRRMLSGVDYGLKANPVSGPVSGAVLTRAWGPEGGDTGGGDTRGGDAKD